MSKKIALGLSGGVDSSVAGWLLKEQGYEVTGVFLECFRSEHCRASEDRRDALRVAEQLDIPFVSLDFCDVYREKVLNYFYETYKAGLTPNPDILCNSEIKFGLFMEWVEKNNFDYLATGHYASIEEGKLMTAVDEKKDQSYFLARMGRENLGRVLFPLGDLKKSKVREIAKENNLITAEKKDSTGVCFVGEINVREFLKEKLGEKKGVVVDEEGKIVGEHEGVWFYTIGQRRGLRMKNSRPDQEALYIVDKDVGKNELVAGGKARTKVRAIEIDDFMVAGPVVAPPPKKLFALAANSFWGSPSASHPLLSSPIYLRIRHLGEFYPVEIEKRGQSLIVTALEGEFEGVAPGQFGVFYGEKDADGRRECLGSGKIKKRCV